MAERIMDRDELLRTPIPGQVDLNLGEVTAVDRYHIDEALDRHLGLYASAVDDLDYLRTLKATCEAHLERRKAQVWLHLKSQVTDDQKKMYTEKEIDRSVTLDPEVIELEDVLIEINAGIHNREKWDKIFRGRVMALDRMIDLYSAQYFDPSTYRPPTQRSALSIEEYDEQARRARREKPGEASLAVARQSFTLPTL